MPKRGNLEHFAHDNDALTAGPDLIMIVGEQESLHEPIKVPCMNTL